MCRTKVSSYSAPLFLSIFLIASTPAFHAQAPAAGTTVAVKMIDTVDSGNDPAGKQYRASVTKSVDAGNGLTIPQGAVAAVNLAKNSNGSGWTTQLVSVTINGQPVAVASGSASVTAGVQSAASSTLSSVGSMLGGLGHHVNAPTGVAAVAMGQRVVLPPGTTLTFVLSQSPASNPGTPAAPGAPAPTAQAGQPGPVQQTAYAAPAPGQDAYLCRYSGQKGAQPIVYVTPILYAGAAANSQLSQGFFNHLKTTYDLSKVQHGRGYCESVSTNAALQANSMDMLEKQWAASKTDVIHVAWTNAPAENAAINANLASAATAAAVPTAAGNQKYVFCHSAWAAGTTVPAGTVMYVSDIFPADMPPPVTHVPGHPAPPANANGAQINRTNALQTSFFAFLQKQYGYKDSGNYPTTCATSFPPTAGGLQSAQSNKQKTEDGVRQLNGQIVETGWKTQ